MAKDITSDRPFGLRDKIGYMFGDFGNDFTFMMSSYVLLKFYTDVMGISSAVVGTIMLIARLVDAVTDVTMGQIVDRSKPTKHGKFKPWLRRMCGPVAVASFLIYQAQFADMAYGFKVAWLAVTYILWGSVFYTSINIPYGSMASAITTDPKERAQLSTWRTIGATLAGLFVGVGTPLFAYETAENGAKIMSGSRVMILAAVFSVCAVICYLVCFSMTTERVKVPQQTGKLQLGKMFKRVFTSRAMLGIILAAICMLIGQLGIQNMAAYIYPVYYGSNIAQSLSNLVSGVVLMLVCAPFAARLGARFGKKEVATVSCLFGSICYFICLIVRPENVYVYMVFFALAYAGLGFFNTLIYAMITDVIDDAEVKNGFREDGTIYSIYSFARKLGQAITSGLVGWLLEMVGYSQAVQYDPWAYPDVMNGMFNIACLLPAIGLLCVSLSLSFVYPLTKSRVESNVSELRIRRESGGK